MFFDTFRKSVAIGITAIVLGALLALVACNSSKSSDTTLAAKHTSSAVANSVGPDIDLNCVIDHLQNPPEPFHYMFKDEQSDNPWSEEAEVTPQMIDVTFMNRSLPKPQTLHATPQEMPHQYQWAIGRMASVFALVHGTAVNEGAETVNGYSTTKLSIDTTKADMAEQGLYSDTLGPGGWEKGTVWVTKEGCPVKIALDEELHSKDGKVSGKAHYEEAMVKK